MGDTAAVTPMTGTDTMDIVSDSQYDDVPEYSPPWHETLDDDDTNDGKRSHKLQYT